MRKLWILAGVVLIAVGVVGMTGRQWNFGKPLPSFEKTWSFASGELRDLTVRSDYKVNISFEKSADGSNSVYVKGQAKEGTVEKVQSLRIQDGTLDLDLRNSRQWLNFFDFSGIRAKEEIVVKLAENSPLDNIDLNVDSGSVTASDLQAKTVSIHADSGSISLNGLTAEKLKVSADSGSIKGSGIRADSLIDADSGSIKLERLSGPARIQSDSGSVKIYKEDTSDLEIRADSGSVYVSLPRSFAGSFDLKADSGSIHAPEAKRETKDLVKVRTDSGSIRIEQE